MRTVALLLVFFLSSASLKAERPYRTYLLTKIYGRSASVQQQTCAAPVPAVETETGIPRYQIPKGNIFCRMEDKLTKATKVWIKVGVQ